MSVQTEKNELVRLAYRVAKLEAALDKACEPITTQPSVGRGVDYANGFKVGAQCQRLKAKAARRLLMEEGV